MRLPTSSFDITASGSSLRLPFESSLAWFSTAESGLIIEAAVRPQTIKDRIKPTTVKTINNILSLDIGAKTKSLETASPTTQFVEGTVAYAKISSPRRLSISK